jgi:hypothetical protein
LNGWHKQGVGRERGDPRHGHSASSVLALLLCVAAALLAGADRAAAARLVLPASILRGFHSAPTSQKAAVADLASGLPRSLVVLVAGADVQVSALVSGAQHLRSDAFVFRSAPAAARVLAAWGRVRHARSVRAGATSYLSARGKLTMVAWRDGARIGVITLKGRGTRDHALGDAVLADGWLRSPLSPPSST